MVEHLLRGCARDIADLLAFDTLRELSSSWAAGDAEQRHGDAAWRVAYADGSGRSLILLLEFQSTVDRTMATRVLRYASMVFDDLRRQDALDADGELRLPSGFARASNRASITSVRALLRRQAERRFGPATARQLAGRLAAITDVEQFALVGDWIIDCSSGGALLALVGNAGAAPSQHLLPLRGV